jgi:hypothetical protein
MRKALLSLALAAAVLLFAGAARAQLRDVALAFRTPADARVIGFHVYLAAASRVYGDYRDDINFVPPADGSGIATYTLTGIEQFSNVYVSLKSYDATGAESTFSNEILVPAQPQCLVTGCDDGDSCTTDTCTASGCASQPIAGCSAAPHECEADTDCAAPADRCAGPRRCVAYACQPGSPRQDETACDDGSASTPYDVCRQGVCTGFACGSDPQCSDGQACNGTERCSANVCVAGDPLQCPTDSGPCFDSFCDLALGCRVQLHPDGEACLTAVSASPGTCSAGVCQPTYTRKRGKHGGHQR